MSLNGDEKAFAARTREELADYGTLRMIHFVEEVGMLWKTTGLIDDDGQRIYRGRVFLPGEKTYVRKVTGSSIAHVLREAYILYMIDRKRAANRARIIREAQAAAETGATL